MSFISTAFDALLLCSLVSDPSFVMHRSDAGSTVASKYRLKPRLLGWLRIPRSSSSSTAEPEAEVPHPPPVEDIEDIASGRDAELRMRMHELLVPTQKTVTSKAMGAIGKCACLSFAT